MIESILNLQKPVSEALKQLGKLDEWLDDEDIRTIGELRFFQENSISLTLLASVTQTPHCCLFYVPVYYIHANPGLIVEVLQTTELLVN